MVNESQRISTFTGDSGISHFENLQSRSICPWHHVTGSHSPCPANLIKKKKEQQEHLSVYIFSQLYAWTLHKQRPCLRAFLTTLVYVEPLLQLATSICYSLQPSRQGDDRYWFCLWFGELNIFFLGGPCFVLWFVLRTWELASSWDMICFGCWMVLREEKEEGWFF